MKTIDRQIALSRQSVFFTEILKIGETRLKVSIESNSYSFQSHAKIMKWSGAKWNVVHFLHHESMKTPHTMYVWDVKKTKEPKHFMADRDQLIKVAKEVLDEDA